MEADPINFDEPLEMPFRLRGKQPRWVADIQEDRKVLSRLLVDAPGGVGKTTIASALAWQEWALFGRRTLVLENRDKLVKQAADRLRKETGLDVDIEQAEDHASPMAPIVVASIQTIGRVNRLTGFSDNHFGLVIPDEAHHSLAPQFRRAINYFHYGAAALDEENWKKPEDGTYEVNAHVVGLTATPDIGKKKNLGETYQKFSVRCSYLEAVEDGWLVPPVAERKPLIPGASLKGLRTGRTPNGSDFKIEDLNERLAPLVPKMAEQIQEFAPLRKTIAFVPSVECARMLADKLREMGFYSIFVSGECLDVDEKTADFAAAGPGTILCNCALYVEGADFPDVDCVAWFRPTVSRAFFIQGVYRGTRVLPGLVNDDMTAEERRAIIAASSKPNVLIIDPLWVTDDISLCSVHDLVTDNPEVKQKMVEMDPELDLIEAQEKASRDWHKALEKAAKKHAKKEAQRIDPLKWALTINEERISDYKPQTDSDRRPLTPGQTEYLDRNKIDRTAITTFGLAQLVIGIHVQRFKQNRATMGQLDFLKNIGLTHLVTPLTTSAEASRMIDDFKRSRRH